MFHIVWLILCEKGIFNGINRVEVNILSVKIEVVQSQRHNFWIPIPQITQVLIMHHKIINFLINIRKSFSRIRRKAKYEKKNFYSKKYFFSKGFLNVENCSKKRCEFSKACFCSMPVSTFEIRTFGFRFTTLVLYIHKTLCRRLAKWLWNICRFQRKIFMFTISFWIQENVFFVHVLWKYSTCHGTATQLIFFTGLMWFNVANCGIYILQQIMPHGDTLSQVIECRASIFQTVKCTNKVYTLLCTQSSVKRWNICIPCFNFIYSVHIGNHGLMWRSRK